MLFPEPLVRIFIADEAVVAAGSAYLRIVALALIIMHLVQIRRKAVIPPHQLQTLDDLLSRNDLNGAPSPLDLLPDSVNR